MSHCNKFVGFGFLLLLFSFNTIAIMSEEVHTLQERETVYQISKKYNIPLEVLLESNDITDPTNLSTGRDIIIPDTSKTTNLGSYKVEKGDTLYSIAKKHNTSVKHLASINKLADANSLRINMSLKVPKPVKNSNFSTASSQTNNSKKIYSSNIDKPIINSASAVVPKQQSYQPKKIETSLNKKTNVPSKTVTSNVLLLEQATSSGRVSAKWPVSGNSYSLNGNLPGILIESAQDTKVKAIASGVVLYAASNSTFRNVVIVQGANGEIFIYGGQKQLFVKQGDVVKKGMIIGEVGIMPFVKKPMLYFAIMKKDKYINPKKYIG